MAKKHQPKKLKAVSRNTKKSDVVRKRPRKAVAGKSVKGKRPASKGRLPLFWKVQDGDMKGLVLCGQERSIDFVSARLLNGVSERFLHPDVERHRANENRADGLQVLRAMEK